MENEKPSNVATPSKLRQPKARKDTSAMLPEDVACLPPVETPILKIAADSDVSSLGPEGRNTSSQKRRLESPQGRRTKTLVLPDPLPTPMVAGDRVVKTYKTSASAAGRPAPVTKPQHRPAPRTAATGRAQLPRTSYNPNDIIAQSTGQRPFWDKKGRLEEMEQKMAELMNKIESSHQSNNVVNNELAEVRAKLSLIEEEKQRIESRLKLKDNEINDLNEDLRQLRRQNENIKMEQEVDKNRLTVKMQTEIEDLTSQRAKLYEQVDMLKRDIANITSDYESLKAVVAKQSSTMLESQATIQSLQLNIEALTNRSREQLGTIQSLTEALDIKTNELQLANKKLQEGETLRRRLHNMVQELKGNIRVFCRVRPLLPSDGEVCLDHIAFGVNENEQEEIKLIQSAETASGNQISKAFQFGFDKVFDPLTTQRTVFEEISQLVQSALDGYRVCIFAYGQTGSGKTFTMEGDASDPERAGMIPLAVQQIFETTERLKEKTWNFAFEASYLEIYNETIRDLLASKSDNDIKYEIKHVEGRTYVTDLTYVPVNQASEIMALLKRAALNRAVAETQCNERSSRSHSVFTLKISGENAVTTEKIEGLLHLVDLAGSERLGRSGSTGDRLKETQAINKSLSSLGDVIHAISNKEAHIPYRNSKLTYLLQNSLGNL